MEINLQKRRTFGKRVIHNSLHVRILRGYIFKENWERELGEFVMSSVGSQEDTKKYLKFSCIDLSSLGIV